MKISEFIKHLEKAKKELGDLKVIFSSDEEGNQLMDMFMDGEDKKQGWFIIFPYNYVEE